MHIALHRVYRIVEHQVSSRSHGSSPVMLSLVMPSPCYQLFMLMSSAERQDDDNGDDDDADDCCDIQ